MPSDWKVRKLKDLIAVRHGYAFASEYYAEDGHHVLLTPGTSGRGEASDGLGTNRNPIAAQFQARLS